MSQDPVPVTRMCVGCRNHRSQPQMLRFRRRPDGVVEFCPWPQHVQGRSLGRTAYLCPSRGCYDRAVKRRAFPRALGGNKGLSVRVESTTLWPSILNGLENHIQRLVRSGGEPHRGRLYSTIRLRDELGVRGKDA